MKNRSETHATEPIMISRNPGVLRNPAALPRLITHTLAALLVIVIPGFVVAAQAKAPEKSSTELSDSTKSDATARKVSVKGVEERKSSQSARAKGEINFDDLKFDLEKDKPFKSGMLNDDVKELVGQRVKLRGYILPATLFKEKGIDQFVLVRDNQECCFGPGAALFDCVIIEMVPGKTTDFVTRPVTVEGKFKIDTEKYKYPGGAGPKGASHFAIFKIDGESVK
jgi:hypothetical protein